MITDIELKIQGRSAIFAFGFSKHFNQATVVNFANSMKRESIRFSSLATTEEPGWKGSRSCVLWPNQPISTAQLLIQLEID